MSTPVNCVIDGQDGSLWDCAGKPRMIRRNYSQTHQDIRTVADLKATLRSGPYAWPGGYPLYFITSDGGALSFATVREEYANIVDSIRRDIRDGWRVVACDVNWEDTELTDEHTGEPIQSAYGAN